MPRFTDLYRAHGEITGPERVSLWVRWGDVDDPETWSRLECTRCETLWHDGEAYHLLPSGALARWRELTEWDGRRVESHAIATELGTGPHDPPRWEPCDRYGRIY